MGIVALPAGLIIGHTGARPELAHQIFEEVAVVTARAARLAARLTTGLSRGLRARGAALLAAFGELAQQVAELGQALLGATTPGRAAALTRTLDHHLEQALGVKHLKLLNRCGAVVSKEHVAGRDNRL